MSATSQELDPEVLQQVYSATRIMALRPLGSIEAAEDAAQETVTRLIEAVNRGNWRPETSLGAFARGIARHVITDVLRRRGRTGRSDVNGQLVSAPYPDPLDELVVEEQVRRVRAALEGLDDRDRELLRLCFSDGLTPGQIAARLHEPPERVRKRKSRALQRLRNAFNGGDGHAAERIPKLSEEPPPTASEEQRPS